ncbi:small GTP-binding protein [Tritrichomonas foetus]|uniref:Small GTP-binding protein n=1 Tax=Tritrichomonas foetus TaxID=1144522 RepID=A0A1J4KVR5_9EUKA|nr:small GTP-binding protein [Tritrichomonas foetus]|eukprot:OHT15319.1 small GTP-binding protein [Tritrichomonas foetus]
MIHYKVVLLGSTHAGKTSIIQRFVNNSFTVNTLASVQSAFFEKNLKIGQTNIVLDIWDTAGQERFHSLTPMYYRDANASIIVFDVTDANSFSKAKQWVSELRNAQGDKTIIMIVGNKNDLKSIRVVRTEEAQKYANSVNVTYMESSAKTGFQIEEIFSHIGHQIYEAKVSSTADGIDVDTNGTDKKNNCC